VPLGVILADDHAIVRQGFAALLQAEPDIALLGQAADGEAAWRLIETLQTDIAILDLAMPKATGIEIACHVEAAALKTRVVLHTMYDDAASALQAQEAGIAGYVVKDNSFEELVMAMRSVAAGGTFVTQAIRAKLRVFQRDGQKPAVLSPREREVIRLIAGARAARRSAGRWPSARGPWIPTATA
jgi:DNA-binding NarL/FixJ family response regulator